MMEDQPLKLIPTCVHMRHKMMYIDDRQATPGMVDDQSDTRVFWCMETQDPLGPDGKVVDPEHCRDGRGCYCDRE